jgi:hypothetical protein
VLCKDGSKWKCIYGEIESITNSGKILLIFNKETSMFLCRAYKQILLSYTNCISTERQSFNFYQAGGSHDKYELRH